MLTEERVNLKVLRYLHLDLYVVEFETRDEKNPKLYLTTKVLPRNEIPAELLKEIHQ